MKYIWMNIYLHICVCLCIIGLVEKEREDWPETNKLYCLEIIFAGKSALQYASNYYLYHLFFIHFENMKNRAIELELIKAAKMENNLKQTRCPNTGLEKVLQPGSRLRAAEQRPLINGRSRLQAAVKPSWPKNKRQKSFKFLLGSKRLDR